jgi:hypothetical protein
MKVLQIALTVGSLVGMSGLALADFDHRYDESGWREQRRDEARTRFEQKMSECGESRWCRRHARREYDRELSHIDRHRF